MLILLYLILQCHLNAIDTKFMVKISVYANCHVTSLNLFFSQQSFVNFKDALHQIIYFDPSLIAESFRMHSSVNLTAKNMHDVFLVSPIICFVDNFAIISLICCEACNILIRTIRENWNLHLRSLIISLKQCHSTRSLASSFLDIIFFQLCRSPRAILYDWGWTSFSIRAGHGTKKELSPRAHSGNFCKTKWRTNFANFLKGKKPSIS